MVSSLSDDASDDNRQDFKFMSPRHLEYLAQSNGIQQSLSNSLQGRFDSVRGIPVVSCRAKKSIRSQTRDFPRNLDRIHNRIRGRIHCGLEHDHDSQE